MQEGDRRAIPTHQSHPLEEYMSTATETLSDRQSSQGFREGPLAKALEQHTAQLPSDTFLWAAAGAALCSIGLQLTGAQKLGNFVGQWVPTILIVGLYNKVVKLHGSE